MPAWRPISGSNRCTWETRRKQLLDSQTRDIHIKQYDKISLFSRFLPNHTWEWTTIHTYTHFPGIKAAKKNPSYTGAQARLDQQWTQIIKAPGQKLLDMPILQAGAFPNYLDSDSLPIGINFKTGTVFNPWTISHTLTNPSRYSPCPYPNRNRTSDKTFRALS